MQYLLRYRHRGLVTCTKSTLSLNETALITTLTPVYFKPKASNFTSCALRNFYVIALPVVTERQRAGPRSSANKGPPRPTWRRWRTRCATGFERLSDLGLLLRRTGASSLLPEHGQSKESFELGRPTKAGADHWKGRRLSLIVKPVGKGGERDLQK